MAKGLSAAKAKRILEDGYVKGKPLTAKQKKYFGAVAGGATPLKKLNGGWLDKFAMGGSLPGASGMMYSRNSDSSAMSPPNLTKAQDGDEFTLVPEGGIELDEVVLTGKSKKRKEKDKRRKKLFEKMPDYLRYGDDDRVLSFEEKQQLKDLGITDVASYNEYFGTDYSEENAGNEYNYLNYYKPQYDDMISSIHSATNEAAGNIMTAASFIPTVRGASMVSKVPQAYRALANSPVGKAAYKYIGKPFSKAMNYKPLSGPLSVGNYADAAAIGYSSYNIGPDVKELYNNPSWSAAGNVGLDALGFIPLLNKKFTKPLMNIGKYYKNPLGDAFKIGMDNPRIPTWLTRGQNSPNKLLSNPKIDADNFMQSWTNPNNASFVSRFDDQIIKPFSTGVMNENYLRVQTRELNGLKQQLDNFVKETGSNVLPKAKSLQKSITELENNINGFYKVQYGKLARDNMKAIQAGEFNTTYSTTGFAPGSGGTYFIPDASQPMNTWKYMYPNQPNKIGVGNNSVVKLREVPVGATDAVKNKARTSEMLTGIHETLGHASNAGGTALTKQTNNLIKSALKKNPKIREGSADWIKKAFDNPNATFKDWADYLQEPTEVLARVQELRRQYINPRYWGTGKQYDVPDKLIDRIFRDGLSGKSKISADFFRVVDKKGLKKLMKGLYATIPMAIGADGLLEYKHGGKTPKAQVGKKVATIASQMEVNEEDGGRPPLGVVDHIRALFDEEGLCRDNTCVETVKDFYSKAGINTIPKDIYNNREFLKNFKEYGFEEVLDQKNLQPGDVLQYYYGPDSEDVKEDPSYLNFPYHMGVYVNPGEYIGDGDSKAPIQRQNMYTGIKDGKEYKKDPFRAFRYIKQNKNGGWLEKFKDGGVIEDDRGQWAYPGKVTKINSNNITMKGVNYPVLGVSDTGDTKVMQPGVENYKYDGNSVTEYPMAQTGDKVVKDFISNYINSPKFKERLTSSNYNNVEDQVIKRSNNIDNTNYIEQEETPGLLETFDKMYNDKPYSTSGSKYDERLNTVIYDKKQDIDYGIGKNSVIAHEYGHAALDGTPEVGATPSSPNKRFLLNNYDSNELTSRLRKYKGQTQHDLNPIENKSDLDAFRFELSQQGIYDAGKEDITKDILKKGKDSFFKKRLLKNYKEEDLIWLMNNIASIDNSVTEYPMAQDGLNAVPDPAPQINFLKDWASSAMHNKMLNASSSSDKFKNKVKSARSNFDDVTISMFDDPGYLGQYLNSNIRMNPSLLKEAPIGNGYNSILTHELSHYTDDVNPSGGYFKGYNIPLSDQKLIKDYSKQGIKRAKSEEKELNELLKSENMNPNSKDVIKDRVKRLKYLASPTETRSRINATRYFYENDKNFGRSSERNIDKNLPSIFDSEVTPDMIKVMQESGQYKQLQESYTDDQILEMFNTISDNSKSSGPSNMAYAQEGAGVNKEGVKQYKWFKNYMRSPKYKERLKKEFPDYTDKQIGQEVKSRLENVMQTRVGFLPRSSDISTGVGGTQGVYNADEYPGAIMLRPEYSASTSDVLFEPGNYLSGYNTIPLHEWSHAADDGGNRMPQSTTDLMLSKMKENSLDIPKDVYYYTKPTEYLGRMQPLRYLMQQEGLYDAGTQNFTIEDLEKAKQNKTIKNNQHFQDLMKNVKSDEGFIELMNNVASLDNSKSSGSSSMAYAKQGRSLEKKAQLTNFTNYNTPQPGGWLDKY